MAKKIQTLGFSEKQAQLALKALSEPSTLTSTLLSTFEPFQACLEYLILHVPECDLPQRFMPSSNSSNPFVSSVHAGTEDLKARWIQDKAVKECGWPAHAVKECVTDKRMVENWGLLLQALNRRLVGRTEDDTTTDEPEREVVDEDEMQAYDARFVENNHLVVPLPVAPLQLHIIFPDDDRSLPISGETPPMYITSTSVAAYVRLHILAKLITAFQDNTLVDPGESIVMAAVRFVEEEWAHIEDNGPPEMSHVLRHFLRRKTEPSEDETSDTPSAPAQRSKTRARGAPKRDARDDATVKAEFERMRKEKAYAHIFAARQRLPAYAAQDTFLDMLEKNRCVIVVGETGKYGCADLTSLPNDVGIQVVERLHNVSSCPNLFFERALTLVDSTTIRVRFPDLGRSWIRCIHHSHAAPPTVRHWRC